MLCVRLLTLSSLEQLPARIKAPISDQFFSSLYLVSRSTQFNAFLYNSVTKCFIREERRGECVVLQSNLEALESWLENSCAGYYLCVILLPFCDPFLFSSLSVLEIALVRSLKSTISADW